MKHTHQLRQTLEEEILEGRLTPGTRLDESSLAKRFEVSRTPIREALLHLGAVGLVEVRPGRGAVVSAPSMKTIIEMFETMAELEGACGRLAARRMTSEDEEALRDAHERCKKAAIAVDHEAYFEGNKAFHSAIYSATRNSFLAEQATALHRRLAPLRRLLMRSRNRMKYSFHEHEMIMDALFKADSDLTEKLLREHCLLQGERFSDFAINLSSIGLSSN